MGTAGKSVGLDHRACGWDGEVGEGLATTSTQILADWVPTCSAQVGFPTGSFSSAEPRRWCNLTRRSGGRSLPELGLQTKNFASPGALSAVPLPRQCCRVIVWPTAEGSFWPLLTRKPDGQQLKAG